MWKSIKAVRTNLDHKTLKLFVEEMMKMFEQHLADEHVHITETTEVRISINHVDKEHAICITIMEEA
jgi:uncharacterized protein YbcI